jgi:type IV fimbrial biogenesis protein FimT
MVFGPGQKQMSKAGMTLPELLFTLSIFAILIAVAAPSLKDLIADRRVAASAQDLYGSMMLARSEAVKRRSSVSLCKSTDGSNCNNAAADWSNGWLVFEDADADGSIDSGDQLIRVFEAIAGVIDVDWNNGNTLGFNSKGQARKAGTFTVCEGNTGGFESREIILSRTGRARVSESGICN